MPNKATIPNTNAVAQRYYRHKWERLLDAWKAGSPPVLYLDANGEPVRITTDGEWWKLGSAYNIAAKTLRWGVEHGLVERRGGGDSMEAWMWDWYRPVSHNDDLGDLWVE